MEWGGVLSLRYADLGRVQQANISNYFKITSFCCCCCCCCFLSFFLLFVGVVVGGGGGGGLVVVFFCGLFVFVLFRGVSSFVCGKR